MFEFVIQRIIFASDPAVVLSGTGTSYPIANYWRWVFLYIRTASPLMKIIDFT